MGHQFPRAVAAAAVTLAACGGGSSDAEPTAVLENARQQVAGVAPSGSAVDDGSTATPDELRAPDPSTFEGSNRIVNLWFGPDGATNAVDVWGRRTFSNGPILLASGIGFGETSSPAGAPANYELSIVGAGAGPDGVELAGMITAAAGERVTTVLTYARRSGDSQSVSIWEQGGGRASDPPTEGMGLVRLVAVDLDNIEGGGSAGPESFSIGDGEGNCRSERRRDDRRDAAVLTSTGDIELELEAGPATLTLHRHVNPEDCGAASVAEVAVDVTADAVTVVLVYSRDGTAIETLTLPVG